MGMSTKSNICSFTGLKISVGRGILFVRNDGEVLNFLSSKARQLYHQKKRASKISWTIAYRKLHKKGGICERLKKKKHARVKSTLRSYITDSYQKTDVTSHQQVHSVLFNENI